MKPCNIKLFLTLFLFAFISVAFSQRYNFHTYTVEDGLSQSQVKALYQDKSGALWIGTGGGGISKYNGKKFLNLTSVNGLCDNNVLALIGDNYGNLWIGTEQGLSRYNGREFENFSTKKGLPNNHVNALSLDSAGNVWVGTDEGICVFISTDSTHNYYKLSKYFSKDGLPADKITAIFIDRKGKIWVGTEKGIARAEKSKGERDFHFIGISENDGGITNSKINAIAQDQGNHLWFATSKALCKLISKSDEKPKFLYYTEKNGLLSDKTNSITIDKESGNIWLSSDVGVTRILFENNTGTLDVVNYTYKSGLAEGHINTSFQDRESNLWFGTENGLTRYSDSRFIVYTKDHGLLNNTVWALTGDKNGDLLIGTDDGLCKLNLSKEEGSFVDYMHKYNINENKPAQCLLQDRENNIWIGMESCVLKLEYQKNGKSDNYKVISYKRKEFFEGITYSILEDSKGNIWFATAKGLVCYNGSSFKKYTKSEGLPDNDVACLMEDRKGILWIGTDKGLCNFDGKGFTKFGSFSGLKFQITSIVEDEAGNLWLGSNSGGGLTRFDHNKYTNISEADGLVSNTVYLLVVDNSGALWVGTNKGLDLFDINYYNKVDSIRLRHYSKNEGFSSIECNQNAVYKDFSGNIWFGTVKGVVKYNPKEEKQNSVPPITLLTGIKLFNKEDVNWSKYTDSVNAMNSFPVNPVLPYDQNYFGFSYLGISLTNPEKVRYKYKLEGFNDEWSEETTETSIPFPNLPYGKYKFYVKSCNNDGVWNEVPEVFSFTITPPIWKTTWFYTLCIIACVIGIWMFIKLRVNQLQKAKKMLEQKIVERTKELSEKNIELEKLSIVARETVNAIAIATPTGEIEWVNESFTRMTGYTLQDLKANKGDTVYQASQNPELKRIIIDCVSTKQSTAYESLSITKEGKEIWIHTTLTPIFDENGRVKKLVFIDTDITETKQAEEIIRQKNKDMMDSINYAKLIQDAILPPKEDILHVFPESFIFFKPREVVSGDFYWFNVVGDTAYIAVADSTGHGVPGAFMSLIGSSLLNEIVVQKGILETDQILNELHNEVRKVLKQDKEGVENRDGMDVALCAINLKTNVLKYSGAMRPLYIINKSVDNISSHEFTLEEIAPDKRSIGGDQQRRVSTFFCNEVKLKKGDTIYLFTDGYADQFGGPKGKKITNARFKEALLSLQVLSMNKQGKLLEQDLKKWMGEHEQVDDVLVMGLKF